MEDVGGAVDTVGGATADVGRAVDDVGGTVAAREAGCGGGRGEFTKPVDRTLPDPVEESWTFGTLSVTGFCVIDDDVAPPTEVKGDSDEATG